MPFNEQISNDLLNFFEHSKKPHDGRQGYGFIEGSFPVQDILDTAKSLIDSGKIDAEILNINGKIIVREA